jgi:antitoxin HigA-1
MMYNPPHPGDVLKDGVFTGTDITIADFAKRIGVTRVTLSRILNGKASVSPDMALRLSAALGGSAETWLHMQANYDLWQAQQKFRPTIEQLRLAA